MYTAIKSSVTVVSSICGWLFSDTCIYMSVHVGEGNQEPSVDVNITVNCLNSSFSIVSWEAPPNSLLNLQYSCFWSENNTRVSSIITVLDCCFYKSYLSICLI